MKGFKTPTVEIVRFNKNDIVTASVCYDYYCDECAECDRGYLCDIHIKTPR